MARKISIQKGFVFGIAAVAVVAVLTGVLMRFGTISASTDYDQIVPNADQSCNIALAEKTASTLTELEKTTFGEKAKAYNIKINGKRAPFRLVVAAKSNTGLVTYSAQMTWLGASGYGTTWTNRVYFLFDDNQGYLRTYGTMYLNEPVTMSVKRSYAQGQLSMIFAGQNNDGCLKNLLDITDALTPVTSPTASVTASRTPSRTPSPTPSRTSSASPTASPTASASAVPATSLVPAASVDATTLIQGAKIEFFDDIKLEKSVFARKVKRISFDWGTQSPAPGINTDNWSDRITSKIMAPRTGEYYIGVTHNDGVKVWLGGRKIIDSWKDWTACDTGDLCIQQVNQTSAKVRLEKGKLYDLKVEHYDKSGKALLMLYWKMPGANTGTLIPGSAYFTTYNSNPSHGRGTGLLGTYFNWNNMDQYKFWRKDARVNFNWGTNGPRSDMNKDNFSVRWTGKIRPRFSETYTFQIVSKDGVKLWVNNDLVIDNWKDLGTATTSSGQIRLGAGKLYPIKIEYYNSKGAASIQLKWTSASERLTVIPASDLYYPGAPNISPGPSVTPSKTASASPSPSPSPSPIALKMTIKPGWNAISIPASSKPVLTQPLRIDPYNFLTFAFDGINTSDSKVVRDWNSSPSVFNKKMGYYIKNPGSQDEVITFQDSNSANSAILYKGWNLIANSSNKPVKLSSMSYTKKTCSDGGANPISCSGDLSTISLGDISYGRPNQGATAYTKIYYVAKPNADSNTPDPFTIYDVSSEGGSANITIPARGVFWLYLFN